MYYCISIITNISLILIKYKSDILKIFVMQLKVVIPI